MRNETWVAVSLIAGALRAWSQFSCFDAEPSRAEPSRAEPSRRPCAIASRTQRPERFDRIEALHRLREEQFGVLVVGGGITGAGVALDGTARGLRPAVVDKRHRLGDLVGIIQTRSWRPVWS